MVQDFSLKAFGSGSSGNSYLVRIGGVQILLDAGVSPKKIGLSSLELVKTDAALITHEHQDHAKYVKDIMRMAIDCYMTEGTKKALGLGFYDFRAKTISVGEDLEIKGLTVRAFQSFHDAAEPVNFLLSGKGINLVYITDTSKAPYKINNMTHIMIEANYDKNILIRNTADGLLHENVYKRILENHLSIDGALEFLRKNDLSRVRKIFLIHLSDKNSDADDFRKRVERLTGKETWVL